MLNPKPRKTDSLNWTLRLMVSNAVESMKWPEGSRFRNYADSWISAKSSDVFNA